ncbi:MAG: hypothetical protein AAF667_07490 [Pseudomonadota bacterium]
MPVDEFLGLARTQTSPSVDISDVTPDDANDLPRVTIALNAATPGRIRITTLSGSTSDIVVAAGTVVPIRATRVWATGTTATGLRALF